VVFTTNLLSIKDLIVNRNFSEASTQLIDLITLVDAHYQQLPQPIKKRWDNTRSQLLHLLDHMPVLITSEIQVENAISIIETIDEI